MKYFSSNNHFNIQSCKDYILLWPSVSFGNVGQLALDLAIHTLLQNKEIELQHVGYLFSENVVPIAGNNAYSMNGSLSLSLEVYVAPSLKLVIVQQRSTVFTGKVKKFCGEILSWMKEMGWKKIVVPTGVDAMMRNDQLLNVENKIYCLSSGRNDDLQKLKIEKISDFFESDNEMWSCLRGTGILHSLLVTQKEKEYESVVEIMGLLRFCAEGDNIPDAWQMAQALCSYLKVFDSTDPIQFLMPSSWSNIYGNMGDPILFQ